MHANPTAEVRDIPFDSLMVKALAEDLSPILSGRRLHRAALADRLTLHLSLAGLPGPLVISLDPSNQAFYLAPKELRADAALRPPFLNVVRSRLEGAPFLSLEPVLGERVILVTFKTRDRLLEERDHILVAEFYGPRGDLHLIDDTGRVLESLRQIRTAPGDSYKIPLPAVSLDVPGEGGSPFVLKEWRYRQAIDGEAASHAFWRQIWRVPGVYQPVSTDELRPPFYPIRPEHLTVATSPLLSLAKAVSDHDLAARAAKEVQALRHRLTTRLNGLLEKGGRKAQAQAGELAETEDAGSYRTFGQAILASLSQIPQGAGSFSFPDWETGEAREIPLLPPKTPQEAAQEYFHRYKRLTARKERLTADLATLEDRLLFLGELLSEVDLAESLHDLQDLARLMADEGLLDSSEGRIKGRTEARFRSFRTSAGRRVAVGRNARENEQLLQSAQPGDLWLHVKNVPGSHVILFAEGGLGDEDRYQAALLAAYFSKGRRSSSVPVDATQRRHVRKPKGSRPGFVIYDHHETLYVTPAEEELGPLLKSEQTARS